MKTNHIFSKIINRMINPLVMKDIISETASGTDEAHESVSILGKFSMFDQKRGFIAIKEKDSSSFRSALQNRNPLIAICLAVTVLAPMLSHAQSMGTTSKASTQEKPAQLSTLTLSNAIQMAERKNGTIAASIANYHASVENRIQSFAAFLPKVTPSYQYNSNRQIFKSSGIYSAQQTEGGSSQITASWNLLDSGQREDNFLSARRNEDSQFFNALQTLRQTIFNVQQQYYETLRAQQLLNVAQAQVQRTKTILTQTKDSVAIGQTAKIAVLQANADYENARVSAIQATNLVSTNAAQLKSLIGYPADQQLPTLEKISEPKMPSFFPSLSSFLVEGIKNRPDLKATRLQVQALHYDKEFQQKQAGLNLSLSANYTQNLTPFPLQGRFINFDVSYPLFDGGSSRAAARAAAYQELSAKKNYQQSVRTARSEIESAYLTFEQDHQEVNAAQIALTAAQANYDQTVQSQKLGSSTLIDVLTAQVSLVTAESNFIQAEYNFDEAELNLRLATGRPLYGSPL